MPSCNNSNLIAAMKNRVTIQSVTQSPDGQGGFTEGWDTVTTVWAAIQPVKAYEKFQAAQLETPISHKITIRYYDGLTTKHRIMWGSRIMNIKEIINVDENNAFLKIIAIEKS